MRNEKQLLEEIKQLAGIYDGLDITQEELEIIETMEQVESCEYVGLKDGHDGEETYNVKLENDSTVYSLYVIQ